MPILAPTIYTFVPAFKRGLRPAAHPQLFPHADPAAALERRVLLPAGRQQIAALGLLIAAIVLKNLGQSSSPAQKQ